MRPLLFAVVVSFAFLGCKKEQPPPAQPAAPAAQADDGDDSDNPDRLGGADVEDENGNGPVDDDDKPVEVTSDMVAKYVGYQKEMLQHLQEQVLAINKLSKETEQKDSLASSMGAVNQMAKMQEASEKKLKELQEKSGLSQREIDQIKDIVADTVLIRGMAKQNQAELAKSMEEAKQKLAEQKDMPPERRKEAEAYIAQMEGSLKSMLDVTDARKKYGDKSVDAVLAHEEELYDTQMAFLKEAGKK